MLPQGTILFIINPEAGTGSKERLLGQIRKQLADAGVNADFVFTASKGNASEIATEMFRDGIRKFVAVGGDGTVNEVGKVLIGTEAELGIIPVGSGNGLARHLGIPMRVSLALETVLEGFHIRIDYGTISQIPFFCTSGLGFDATLGKVFSEQSLRGFGGYITSGIREFFHYQPKEYRIRLNGQDMLISAFLLSFANASQYGNNATIAPSADIMDGLLDMVVFSPFPLIRIPELGIRLFTRQIDKSRYIQILKCEKAEILLEREMNEIHYDGEPASCGQTLQVAIHPHGLNVIVPRYRQDYQ